MRRIKQLRALSGDERYFLARAVFWLPLTSLLLHLVGFRRTLGFFKRGKALANNTAITSHHRHTAQKAARMIDIAANHGLYRARCLQKSLVLIKFMRACEIPCSLVLGARRQGDAFDAHAWVECGGVVVNDDADVGLGFTPFNVPAERMGIRVYRWRGWS